MSGTRRRVVITTERSLTTVVIAANVTVITIVITDRECSAVWGCCCQRGVSVFSGNVVKVK